MNNYIKKLKRLYIELRNYLSGQLVTEDFLNIKNWPLNMEFEIFLNIIKLLKRNVWQPKIKTVAQACNSLNF